MTPRPSIRIALMIAAALVAPACSKVETAVKGVAGAGQPFDKGALEAALDKSLGGPTTCVLLVDARNGSDVYRYGLNTACARPLPPCATFHIPSALIALDAGAATPTTMFKWDHTPQPAKAWEHDVDMTAAFKQSINWVFQQLAHKLGAGAYEAGLKTLDYGDHHVSGPIDAFWQGPEAGGTLGVSTRDQARFLQRLYAGKLAVKAQSAVFVTSNMVDEIRSGSTMSGRTGTCPSIADGSRQVGWWIGRVKGPKSDYVFAASIEGENALPGLEVQTRIKQSFARAGIWPAI
jgi:beta-lactamase class D